MKVIGSDKFLWTKNSDKLDQQTNTACNSDVAHLAQKFAPLLDYFAFCWCKKSVRKTGIKKSAISLGFSIAPFFMVTCLLVGTASANPTVPNLPNALPTGAKVTAGSAFVSQAQTPTSASMTVNQTSQRAVVNWDSFNVGKNATVTFNQPNANAVTLNRVTGATASMIEGAVKANGQVVFVNPNGVTFGRGAEINAAGVVATTMDISNKDFMEGKGTYKGNGKGSVINEGKITTNTEGGYIALLAPEVRNDGYLLAKKGSGTVAMAAGEQITLDFKGNSLISVKVDIGTYNALIENKRVVEVNGGLVVIAAGSANQLMASVIKNTGRISASSMVNNGGVIELVANTINQAGQVTANSKTAEGGQINIVGNDIAIVSNSKTTATGATNGGQVNIGLANTQVSGGTQVNVPTQAGIKANANQAAQNKQLAQTVTIEDNALIDTSSTQTGNGGAIAIWSEVKTTVAGILKSMGGALSGNGGFIETSSKGTVNLAPTVSINTSANNLTGKAGTWLLDPIDLTIDTTTANLISAVLANSNVTIAVTSNTNTCPIGSCTQNGAGSLTIASGADILKAGTNLTTLTLSSAGIFNLNANISGQNLSVIISSSIAYLNVGTTITASEVTVQAQTIYASGNIQTSNYLAGTNPGILGNAIQLLAQAIYVSGRLAANASQGVAGSIKLEANTVTLQAGAALEANGNEGGLIAIAANDANFTSAVIQANGGNGRGGTLILTAANDQYFNNATLLANGTTDGGALTITTSAGDIYFSNSLIQTNGSSGRGGSIGLSATHNTDIANSTITANGYTQGGKILIGNDAKNGTLPFSILTSLDSHTTINAAQLDSSSSNKAGGFIETSGQTINLLSSINAGRGGMWLLDPYNYTIGSTEASRIRSALNSNQSVTITTSNSTALSGGNSISGSHTSGSDSITINNAISATGSGSLTFTGSTIRINANITTVGAQTYNGAVTLGGDVTLTGSTINFNSTVSGAYGLTIAGNAVFGNSGSDTVSLTGSNKALSVSGTSMINANITTSGAQTYTRAVTLGNDITLNASGITTVSTIAAGSNNLTVIADSIAIGGAITGSSGGILTIQPKSNSTTIGLAGGVGSLSLDTDEMNYLRMPTVIIGGSSATGSISMNAYSTLNSAVTSLTLQNSGLSSNGGIAIAGAISNLKSFTVTSAGSIRLNANVSSSSYAQTYSGAVVLGNDITLTGSTINFNYAVSGAYGLTIAGNAVFGNSSSDTISLSGSNKALSISGASTINANITTSGIQTYAGSVSLGNDVILTGTTLTFNAPISGSYGLSIGGNAIFGNSSSDTVFLTGSNKALSVSGTSTINANITTSGAQTYTGAITLGNDITLTASGITTLNSIAAGAHDLILATDAIAIGGAITGIGSSTLTVQPKTNNKTIGLAGGAGVINLSTTELDYLQTPTILIGGSSATGLITINAYSTLNSAVTNLTLQNSGSSSNGGITIAGAFSGLRNLTLTSAGAIRLNADVSSVSTEIYNGTVALGGDTSLTGSTIIFNSPVSGAYGLAIIGNAVFGNGSSDAVSLTGSSKALSVSGTTRINANITTSGSQTYDGAVTLGSDVTLRGSEIAFNATVSGAYGLTITGDAVFGNSSSDRVSLTGSSKALSVSGTSAINANITTSGAQTYGGAVTLRDDIVLTGTTITFNQSINTMYGLTINGNTIIYSNISSSGAQTYNGSLAIRGNVDIEANSFTASSIVTNGNSISITTSDFITINGLINADGSSSSSGNGLNGGAVTINADGILTVGGITTNGGNSTYSNSGRYYDSHDHSYHNYNNSYDGGNAGNVTLSGSLIRLNGNIEAVGGSSNTGSTGIGGAVTLNASLVLNSNTTINAGSIAAGAITTYGNNITLAASDFITIGGLLNTDGLNSSSGKGSNAGGIDIQAGGELTLSSISANGGNSTYVNSGRYYDSHDRSWHYNNSSYTGGDAGAISLTGSTIYLGGNISAVGGSSTTGNSGNGGAVTFQSPLVLNGEVNIQTTGRTDGVVSFKSTVDGSSAPQATFYLTDDGSGISYTWIGIKLNGTYLLDDPQYCDFCQMLKLGGGNFNDSVLSIRLSPRSILTLYQDGILGGWNERLDNSANNSSALFVLQHTDGSSFTLEGSGIGGGGSLEVNSGQKTIVFSGAVGANTLLGNLTTLSPTSVGANIFTMGNQTYGAAVTLSDNVRFEANNFVATAITTSGRNIAINTTGDTTISGLLSTAGASSSSGNGGNGGSVEIIADGTLTLSSINSNGGNSTYNNYNRYYDDREHRYRYSSGNSYIGGNAGAVNLRGGVISISGSISAMGGSSNSGESGSSGDLYINIRSDSLVSGSINARALNFSVDKQSLNLNSTLSLSSNQIYTGNIQIGIGVLSIIGSGSLGGGNFINTLTVSPSGTFNFISTSSQLFQAGSLAGTGTINFVGSNAAGVSIYGDQPFAGTMNVGQKVDVAGGDNGDHSGLGFSTQININNHGYLSLLGGDNSFIGGYAATTVVQINAGGTLYTPGGSTFHLHDIILNGGTITSGMPSGSGLNYGVFNFDSSVTALASSEISAQSVVLTQSGGTQFIVDGGVTLTISSSLIDANYLPSLGLIKNGIGTLILSGNNTYSGDTSINAGTLAITTDNGLGNNSGGIVTVARGATLDLLNVAVGAKAITLNGGTLKDSTSSLEGNITLNADSFISVTNSDALTLSGAISGSYGLTKLGAGTLVLSGSNTYSGGTYVNEGLVLTGSNSAFGSGLVTINSGASVDLNGQSFTNDFALSGSGSNGSGALVNSLFQSTSVLDGAIFLANNTAIGGRANINLNGVVSDASAYRGPLLNAFLRLIGYVSGNYSLLGSALTKEGNGTITLINTNSYSGRTIVNDGTLAITSDRSLGSLPLLLTIPNLITLNGGTLLALNDVSLNSKRGINFNEWGSLAAVEDATFTIGSAIAGHGELKINYADFSDPLLGTVKLSGRNTYTGSTTLNSGSLKIGIASGSNFLTGSYGALGRNTDLYINGGTLDLNGFNQAVNSVVVNASNSSTIEIIGNNKTLTATGFIFTNYGNINVSAILAGNNSNLTIDGFGGTTTLSGANTFSGVTTINLGAKVILSGSGRLSNSSSVHLNGQLDLQVASATLNSLIMSSTGFISNTTAGSDPSSVNSDLILVGVSSIANVISTGGSQTYNGPVTLVGDIVLGGNSIHLNNTVDGAYQLGILDSGVTTIGAAIGETTALSSISIESANIKLNGAGVKTTGDQVYGGAVALGADTTLTASDGSVYFYSTVDSDSSTPFSLTIANGLYDTIFASAIGSINPLNTLSISGNATLGGDVYTAGDQLYSGNVILAAENISLNSNANGGAGNVTIVGDISSKAAQPIILKFLGDGNFAYSTNGGISFIVGTAIGSSASITGGNIEWDGGAYTWLPNLNANASLLLVAGGGSGGSAYGSGGGGGGGVIYQEGISVGQNIPMTITVGQGGTAVGGATGNNGGNSSFGGNGLTLLVAIGGGAGGSAYTLSTSGGSGGGERKDLHPPSGPITVSSVHPGSLGTTNQGFAGGSGGQAGWIVSSEGICCGGGGGMGGGGGGAGGLGQNASYNLAGDGVGNAGNGGNGLSFAISGSVVFYGGGGGGGVEYANISGVGGQGGGGNGGNYNVLTGSNGAANTGGGGGGNGSSRAASGGDGGSGIAIVRWSGSGNPNSLTINSGSGKVTLGGATTNLASLTINSTNAENSVNGSISGNTNFTVAGVGGVTNLTAANTYTGATTIGAGATLILSGVGSINNSSAVNLDGILDLQASSITLNSLSMGTGGFISNTAGVSNLILNGPTSIANTITTSGSQTYNGAVSIAAYTLLTGNEIHINNTVDGNFSLMISDVGTTTISGAIGSSAPLTVFGIDSNNLFLNANITTTDSQKYNAPIMTVAEGVALNGSAGAIRISADSLNIGSGARIYSDTGILVINTFTEGKTISIGADPVDDGLTLATSMFSGISRIFGESFSNIIIGNSATGDIYIGGTAAFDSSVSILSGGNITIQSGATISNNAVGGQIVLSAFRNFINYSGSAALSVHDDANARWIVYSASPTTNIFGIDANGGSYLVSGNDAYWGSNIDTLSSSAVGSGNRYVFRDNLSLTISLRDNPTKVYGEVIDASNYSALYTVTTNADPASYHNVFTNSGSGSISSISIRSDGFEANANVGGGDQQNGGKYLISLDSAEALGYSVNYGNTNSYLTISPATAYVMIGANQSSTYGSTPSIGFTFNSNSTGTGSPITVSDSLGGVAVIANAPTAASSVGSYSLMYVSGLSTTNYVFSPSTSSVEYVVNKAPLAIYVTGTYNSTTTYTSSNASIRVTGLVVADAAGLVTSVEVNNRNVADANYVTAINGVSGFNLNNYHINIATNSNLSGSTPVVGDTHLSSTNLVGLSKADLSIASTLPFNRVYDGAPVSTGYSVDVKGSDANLIVVTGIVTETNAGRYTPNLVASGAVLANYNTPSIDNGTLVIQPKPVTITNNLINTVYNGSSSYAALMANASYTHTDLVGLDAVGSLTQAASKGGSTVTGIAQAGNFTSTPSAVILSTGNPDNYSFFYVGKTNSIAKADLTINAVESLTGNVYRGSSYTGSYTTSALGSDAASISITGLATGINAGTYVSNLSASGAVLSNYNTPVITNANFVISPKAVTITNNQISTTYDGVSSYAALMANASYTHTDLVGSDAVGSVSQTASKGGSTVIGIAQAGNFTSTPSAVVLSSGNVDNYSFTYTGKNNSIAKADLAISGVESLTGNTYRGTAYTGTYTTNALGNDAAGISVTGMATGINAGTYVSNLSASGAVLSNYNTPVITNANFVISPAPLGIELTGTYSGTRNVAPSTFTITGLMNGDTVRSIVSANLADANVASNGANYVTSVTGVAGTAVMSNYYITTNYNSTPNTTTTNTATITPANLVVTATTDAKFVTQSDLVGSANNCGVGIRCDGGYMGVTYNGFVNGENKDVLQGSPVVIRTNDTVDAAGVYPGVLKASGHSASNYSITYANGDYIIAPAKTLLVRVTPDSRVYGAAPAYTAKAQYLDADNRTIIDLVPSINGSAISIVDGASGAANFTLSLAGATTSTSGNINVGGYNLIATNSAVTGNNFNSLTVVGSNTIIPYTLRPNQLGISGVSKVYDGNINIGGLVLNVDPTLSTVLGSGATKDQVTIIGSGTFDNRNVGTNKAIDVNLTLSGTDGGNYVLDNDTYSANIGTIIQLNSVSYVGGVGGKWSTQSNWAGGAIPTLNNVANVYIPVGSSAVYDVAAVNAPGAMGSNIINNGTLTINESINTTITNTLGGSGTYAQTGAGILTIAGNNNQINPGPLTGQISVANGKTLILANTDALGNGSILSDNGRVGLGTDITLRSLTINGPVTLISDVRTLDNQQYGGAVTLNAGSANAPMVMSSQNGNIAFLSTVNSDAANRSLTLNALAGKVTLTDTAGYLSPSRLTKGPSITDLLINAKDILLKADVYTLSTQTYSGAVVISDNGSNGLTRSFLSQDPSITFLGTIDDSLNVTHTLDLKAVSFSADQVPAITFRGAIGSIVPLGGLVVTMETHLDPALPPTPAGTITIGGGITTIGPQTFTGGGIFFDPAPGAGPIILSSKNGPIEFFDPNGLSNALSGYTQITGGASQAISPQNNLRPVVQNIVTGYLPPLDPDNELFRSNRYGEGSKVSVGEPSTIVPCEAELTEECVNG